MMMRRLTSSRAWAYGLFWSWNIIFLAFMFLGFAPQLLPEMLTAVRAGTVPAAFLAYGAILVAIPALLRQQETIRAGLLNAYLAPQRYLSALGEVRHVSEMYRTLGLTGQDAARVQQLYEGVA